MKTQDPVDKIRARVTHLVETSRDGAELEQRLVNYMEPLYQLLGLRYSRELLQAEVKRTVDDYLGDESPDSAENLIESYVLGCARLISWAKRAPLN